jgi:hypothetical protein
MGRLVMSFVGICLHVSRGSAERRGHRVIAVHATEQDTKKWGKLPAHHCYLQLLGGAVTSEIAGQTSPVFRSTLIGWSLRVANAYGPLRVNLDELEPLPGDCPEPVTTLESVPCLTTYDRAMKIRPDLFADEGPFLAAAFVDIENGDVRAHRFCEGGVYTTWTVETDGEPELILRSRGGEVVRMILPSTPEGAHFPEGIPGTAALHNSTLDQSDKKFDFLLHYLAAEGGIPDHFDVMPPLDDGRSASIHWWISMTTSCSNSRYP